MPDLIQRHRAHSGCTEIKPTQDTMDFLTGSTNHGRRLKILINSIAPVKKNQLLGVSIVLSRQAVPRGKIILCSVDY